MLAYLVLVPASAELVLSLLWFWYDYFCEYLFVWNAEGPDPQLLADGMKQHNYHGMTSAVHCTLHVPEYGAQQMTLYPATSARHLIFRGSLDSDKSHGCQNMIAGMKTNHTHYHDDDFAMHVYAPLCSHVHTSPAYPTVYTCVSYEA